MIRANNSKKRIEVSNKIQVIYLLFFLLLVIIIIPEDIIERPTIFGKVVASVRILGTNPPTFDHDIGNFTILQTDGFYYDVNCSDIDILDVITYSINFSELEINSSTGIINKTSNGSIIFNQTFVQNNTIQVSCSDDLQSVTKLFILEILNVNEPPVLDAIGPQIATESVLFTLDIDATDVENDTLSYNASTTLFTINNETGLINFTPTLSQVGNYTINFSVFDGLLYDSEVISFRIVRGPYCGDAACGSEENCTICSADCGACPTLPAQEPAEEEEYTGTGTTTSGTTGTGVSVSGQAQAPYYRCDEKWECSDWSICSIEGLQSRTCTDINKCPTKAKKPSELAECVYQPTCLDGIQNGGETGIDCGGPCEPCITVSCFDGIQNQNETDVDCGGPCKPCEVRKITKAPLLEIPAFFKIPKKFPWLLILIILIIIILIIIADQIYVRRLSKKDRKAYREAMKDYRLFRRKLYKFIISTVYVTFISSTYIYFFSDNINNLIRYSWIPIILILLTPFVVSWVIRQYTFYEYKKRMKEKGLAETHKHELLQLIRVENEILFDLELKLKNKIYQMAVKHKFDDFPSLYNEINPLYGELSKLEKNREERIDLLGMPSTILDKILNLISDITLEDASKEYPEFLSILKNLKYIEDNRDQDTTDKEKDLIRDIEEISMPQMKIVITSDKKLTDLYNKLVDIFDYYSKKNKILLEEDDKISDVERSFTDKMKDLTKKSTMIETIQKNSEFSKIYNGLVDLFNHYIKKMELSKSIKGL